MTTDRRTFLQLLMSSAVSAAFPASISRALSISANSRTGTIADVEHVVIMIQENRSFDHYFGTLRGVRGFGDRRDRHVLAQADGTGGSVYPFRIRAASTGGGCTADPLHLWGVQHESVADGRMDGWVTA